MPFVVEEKHVLLHYGVLCRQAKARTDTSLGAPALNAHTVWLVFPVRRNV